MLISRAWLTELLADSGVDLSATDDRALAAKLTDLGLEVESVRQVGQGLEAVRVGLVADVRPHPDADKLRVVDLHDGVAVRTIVCGAPNVPAPGGKVAFVAPGAVLPGGLEIAARPVRGVASAGMICSEDELDIGPDSAGILVLPDAFRAGERLADRVPGLVDTIIELGVTPNRPDALGHVGVARDLAVKLGHAFVPPSYSLPDVADAAGLVEIAAPDRCGRYLGFAFTDARIASSPPWLRVRLHRLGLRPLSNVVDVTNMVMLEWGQPLHAFDRAKLAEGRVVARLARSGETMRMLDGRDIELRSDDLVIADARVPQALAGVMGGEHSGVDAPTTDLLLEAAWFQPAFVRRTAKAHGMSTDSSHRFERGVDHGDGLERACARACNLLVELAGARAIGKRVVEGERPAVPKIPFRPARSRLLLGIDVPAAETRRIFAGLGIAIESETELQPGAARWICRPPTHRPDLELEVDLIEEIVRHHGLDKLPMRPSLPSGPSAEPDRAIVAQRRSEAALMDALVEHGLHETISFVFTRPEIVEAVGDVPLAHAVALANPMRSEASLLRTHMLPGLMDALSINLARHAREVALFERGRVYAFVPHPVADGPTAVVDRRLPAEWTRLAVLRSAGVRPDPEALARADARELGATLVHAIARIGHAARVVPARDPVAWLHPGAQAEIAIEDPDHATRITVGRFGRVHPAWVERWDVASAAAPVYGELWLECVPAPRVPAYTPLPRFPSTARDVSLDLAVTVPAAVVIDAIVSAHRELALAAEAKGAAVDPPRLATGDRATAPIELVEDWRGEGVPAGRRALLLRLHYRAQQRSVTDAEVQTLHVAVIERAVRALRTADADIALR